MRIPTRGSAARIASTVLASAALSAGVALAALAVAGPASAATAHRGLIPRSAQGPLAFCGSLNRSPWTPDNDTALPTTFAGHSRACHRSS